MTRPSPFQASIERWCLDVVTPARCCCPPEQPSAECAVDAHRTAAEHVLVQTDPGEARELALRHQRLLERPRAQQGMVARLLGHEPTQRDYALAGTGPTR